MKKLSIIIISLFFLASATLAKDYSVKMKIGKSGKFVYSPNKLKIKLGDTVTWVLVDGPPHTVTFYDDKVPGKNKKSKSKLAEKISSVGFMMKIGQKHSVTFKNVPTGKYNYYCIPHQSLGMKGQIIVNK